MMRLQFSAKTMLLQKVKCASNRTSLATTHASVRPVIMRFVWLDSVLDKDLNQNALGLLGIIIRTAEHGIEDRCCRQSEALFILRQA